MFNNHSALRWFISASFLMLMVLATGCHSMCRKTAGEPTTAPSSPAAVLRIKTGASVPYTSPDGTVWQADQGFDGGDTADRDADLPIANTNDPALYRSERYSMAGYSFPLPNGKYTVKLHFAETYEDITAPGQRVFSFNVQGHDFKDFDLWLKAGGPRKAYIQTVPVEVTNGKLQITFTANVDNPEINAIEIIPD